MKKLKYSLVGQIVLMTKTHLVTALLFLILFLFLGAKDQGTVYKIFGFFGTLGCFLSIYSNAASALNDDKKTISPLNEDPKKGFILPVGILLINVFVIIIYKLAWAYGSAYGSDGILYITQTWSAIFNIISLLWVMPYHAFLGMDYGVISLTGYIIIFVTPVVASALGYFAAYKGFDLNAKMHSFAYEKKDKNKEEF